MTQALAPRPPAAAVPSALRVHRLSVEQYHGMIRAGVLGENDRVELLDGWLVTKMTHNPPHDCAIALAGEQLRTLLPKGCTIRVQSAITTAESEPEPDLVVAHGTSRTYARRHPAPADIPLVIEVADSSLAEDRALKQPIYARGRIPVYWIVNLVDGCVEVYTQPRAGRSPAYRHVTTYTPGQAVPVVIDGAEVGQIPVAELLP